MKSKNKFIVFEGIDGCGKSTLCSLLYDFIKSKNIPVQLLCEPTNGKYGQMIRKILQDKTSISVEEQIHLFIEDRKEDYKLNIRPCIENGITIVMDRYFYSNAAYQGCSKISPIEIIERNLNQGFPIPDRVYYIDIDPQAAMKRITARSGSGKTELFEKKTFLEGVRKNFLSMTDRHFLKIDGSLSVDEISNIIKDDYLKLN
ncbi:MAG: dTMP kinase [Spirochaetes bacterium]|nr:dTMP kinase [Spirochaetota bacterium]